MERLNPVANWFNKRLTFIWPDALYHGLSIRLQSDKRFLEFVSTFLRSADTGVESVNSTREPLDLERHLLDIPPPLRNDLLKQNSKSGDHDVLMTDGRSFYNIAYPRSGPPELVTLKTAHLDRSGKQVQFETRDESDGTLRLMHLAPILCDMQESGRVYVVDELDRSMHPLLSRLYVEQFLKAVRQRRAKAQLIVTTHEPGRLDLERIRRDEIWFVQKDAQGASSISSLAEYKAEVRSDLRVGRGYLNGRFGAIPLIAGVDQLLA